MKRESEMMIPRSSIGVESNPHVPWRWRLDWSMVPEDTLTFRVDRNMKHIVCQREDAWGSLVVVILEQVFKELYDDDSNCRLAYRPAERPA